MAELLKGVTLYNQDGDKLQAEEHLQGKLVALYFSAGWCPPCRQFTPKLKRFFEAVKAAGKDFEIIFISRDREDEDLKEYFEEKQGDWTYIGFGDPKLQELNEKYEVKTIPAVKVIKADGTVVSNDARNEIAEKGGENPLELYEEWEAFC